MNVLKNMEAIFLVSAVLLCAAGYASATVHSAPVSAPAVQIADGRRRPDADRHRQRQAPDRRRKSRAVSWRVRSLS